MLCQCTIFHYCTNKFKNDRCLSKSESTFRGSSQSKLVCIQAHDVLPDCIFWFGAVSILIF